MIRERINVLYIRSHFYPCVLIHAMGAQIQNSGHPYTSPEPAFPETSHWDSFSCTVHGIFYILFFDLQKGKPIFHFLPLASIYSLSPLFCNISTAIGCHIFFKEKWADGRKNVNMRRRIIGPTHTSHRLLTGVCARTSPLPQKFRCERKRGRVLQRQTRSVMQDYSVSFSTAIDVLFMGGTQGFSERSGPCYPAAILETKTEGGEGWRGFSPGGPRCLMAAIFHPRCREQGVSRGGMLEADLVSHLGALMCRRWDQY